MKYRQIPLITFAALSVSLALAEDFKTLDGKEYKNATVTHVEPDGIVVKTKSGISKLYFQELPKDVQQRFNYDPQQATAYSAQQNTAMQRSNQQLGKEQAGIQWMAQQRQDAASLQFQLQTLQTEKYNTMEQIRLVHAAPHYVETGRDGRGRMTHTLNSVKADLPILNDHLHDVERDINSVKKQLEQTQRGQR